MKHTVEFKTRQTNLSGHHGLDVCDIMNYESPCEFEYIKNSSTIIDKQSPKQFRYGDNQEKKKIIRFVESMVDMDTLFRVVDFGKEDIQYCFNS